jgi:4-amino-4-deoxy-L-arabinose transferase-like glycosyltransferase
VSRLDRFTRVLLVIAIVGLGVRLTYLFWGKSGTCIVRDPATGAEISSPTDCPGSPLGRANDATYYNGAANLLARGDGFRDPFRLDREAADHPPLTVFVLAPVSWAGDHVVPKVILDDLTNAFLHRLTMVFIGTGVVVGVGLLARRIGGSGPRADRIGWIAAAVAAVYPGLWISDALIFAETITNFVVVVTLLLALRAREQPSARRLVALGVAIGVCGLARAELLLFVPLLGVLLAKSTMRGSRVRVVGTLVVSSLVVITPWIAYNNARFDRLTLLSTNDGLALAASNCLPVYSGSAIGLTRYDAAPIDASPEEKARDVYCIEDPEPQGDQSAVSAAYRDRALRIMGDHVDRLPAVVAARVGRTWNVFRPFDMVVYNEGEDREPWATRLGIWSFYPVAVAAIAGGLWLRRRDGFALAVLVVPIVTVTFAAAATYGQARFRSAAEASLVVLAAIAIDRAMAGRTRSVHAKSSDLVDA